MQLIVLGMHRSGTSVLARMLNLMGAYFGTEGTSTGANQENPKGFWERRDVRTLNDDVLFSIGCDWNRISTLDLARVPPAVQRDFDARAFQIVLDLDAHRPWMLKEPRLCLLLPMWQRVLELPVFIHIVRHPVEVAASLKTRNAMPLPVGLTLWEQYNRHALAAAQGMPIITVLHRRLMMEPAAVATEVFQALVGLGIAGLRMPTDAELGAFVRLDLYREREGRGDLRGIGLAQSRLFEQLAAGRHPRRLVDGAPSKRQLAVLHEYEESLPAFTRKPSAQEQREEARRIEMQEMERLKMELETRTLEHATLKGEIGMLREWVADAKDAQTRQIAATEAAKVEAADEVRRLQAVAAELRTELAQATAATKTLEANLNAELGKAIATAAEERAHAMSEQADRHRLALDGARQAQEALQGRLNASAREIAMLTRRLLQAEETEDRMRHAHAALQAELGSNAELHASAMALKSAESASLAEELELAHKQIASLQVRAKRAEETIRGRDVALAASKASEDKLASQYIDARQALDALLSSTSWRWSAPLRILSRLFRGDGPRHPSPVDRDDAALLRGSSLFDADWYRRQYPDIAASQVDPVEHYLAHGAVEGRDPGPGFSTQGYLVRNPDVGAAGMNPLVHYLRYGKAEGRSSGLPARSET